MNAFNKVKISYKLPIAIILLAICTASTMSWLSYSKAREILIDESKLRLVSNLTNRDDTLTKWMSAIASDLENQSTHPTTQMALKQFSQGWNALDGNKTVYLKNAYIANNPHPVGSKELLDTAQDGSQYSQVHKQYHRYFHKLQNENGYYDVFLFDARGNLIYTVFKEQDFATNLNVGQWAKSDLGKAFREATTNPQKTVFYDFREYGPSNDAPASFMARAITGNNGEVIGVIAYQMPVDRLSAIMNDSIGLGETGEAFVVGQDLLMRSDSRFSTTSTILKTKIETAPVVKALAGENGIMQTVDTQGRNIIAAYNTLDVMGNKWAVIVQQSSKEIMAPVKKLKQQLFMQLATARLRNILRFGKNLKVVNLYQGNLNALVRQKTKFGWTPLITRFSI